MSNTTDVIFRYAQNGNTTDKIAKDKDALVGVFH